MYCISNGQTCTKCLYGFVLNEKNKCVSCPENCQECTSPNTCDYCNIGFYLDGFECKPCPPNCERCSSTTNECYDCLDSFVMQDTLINGTHIEECISCPDNCDECYEPSKCNRCNDGYGFIYVDNINTYQCGKCSENCFSCLNDKEDCYYCKDGYCIEESKETYNHYCVPCKENPTSSTSSTTEVIITPTISPTPEPIIMDVDYGNVDENGNYDLDFDDAQITDNSAPLEIILDSEKDKENNKEIQKVTITNNNNKNTIITITGDYKELTFQVNKNSHNEFDIISTIKSIKINLDESTFASIKQCDGQIEINSTKENSKVNLNQVQPSSNDFKIIPNSQINIKEVQFSENQSSLLIQSCDNKKVEIQTIKVQPGTEGKIENATIKGKISLALLSNLNINENVDLGGSTLDFPYSNTLSSNENRKAPINGIFNGKPKGIIITSRNENTWLDNEKLLLAESSKEFDCDSWGKLINYQSSGKLNDFECENKNNAHRLYAIENPGKNDKGGGLSGAIIAAIVIAVVVVVGVIVFLLVYFLVIKKKKKESSDQEEGDDKNANEV